MTTIYDLQRSDNAIINFLTICGNSSHPKISRSGMSLLSHLIKNEQNLSFILNTDIPVFIEKYGSKNIQLSNAFNILGNLEVQGDLTEQEYQAFLLNVFKYGISIKPVLHFSESTLELGDAVEFFQKQADKITHCAFSEPEYMQEKYINKQLFLLNYAYENMPLGEFITHLQQFNTLHFAVNQENHALIDFLLSKNIDINLPNEKGDTPLMWAKSFSILEKLNLVGANWLASNHDGEDAIVKYANILNENIRKKMMDYTQEQAKKMLQTQVSSHQSNINLQQRNAKTLLNLVSSNKTKKELDTFLKSYPVSNIGEIVDEQGNSLVQISLIKGNWARAKMFMNDYPIEHLNHNGQSALSYLLGVNKPISYEDKAIELLGTFWSMNLHSKNHHNVLSESYLNILTSYSANIPFWLNKNNKILCDLINPKHRLFEDDAFFRPNSRSSRYDDISLKACHFLAQAMAKNNFLTIDLMPAVDDILNEKEIDFNKSYVYYPFDSKMFNFLLDALEPLEINNIHYNNEYFEIYLKNKIMSYLNMTIDSIKEMEKNKNLSSDNETRIEFLKKSETLFQFLLDRKYIEEINSFPQDIIFNEQFSPDLQLGMQYAYMLYTAEKRRENSEVKKSILRKI